MSKKMQKYLNTHLKLLMNIFSKVNAGQEANVCRTLEREQPDGAAQWEGRLPAEHPMVQMEPRFVYCLPFVVSFVTV